MYNQISVTTNIKNSGLLVRIQDGDMVTFCGCVGRTENESM